jgi:hypothetical protein
MIFATSLVKYFSLVQLFKDILGQILGLQDMYFSLRKLPQFHGKLRKGQTAILKKKEHYIVG